jgi:hypothetical protein
MVPVRLQGKKTSKNTDLHLLARTAAALFIMIDCSEMPV